MSSPESTSRTGTEVPRAFDRYRPAIQSSLRDCLLSYTSPIHDTHRYYMGWEDADGNPSDNSGGKRLRPTLALLAGEAMGGTIERAMPIAIALEYVHNFSLIHDDLEDRDQYRHHQPTVWYLWGDATAIISGTAMLKVADNAAKQLARSGVSPPTAVALQHQLVAAYLRIMEGQFLDIKYETVHDVTLSQYFQMIARKTGALITASLQLGARTAGQRRNLDADVAVISAIGKELGAVFQIRDDILGVWGGELTGKPVGSDIRRKKKSLPAIHALNNAREETKTRLNSIYLNGEPASTQVDEVLEIMDDVGTRHYCQTLCEQRWKNADALLDTLHIPDKYRRDLKEIGTYLLERES